MSKLHLDEKAIHQKLLVHIWDEWSAEFLDRFRNEKKVGEPRRRREAERRRASLCFL